MPNPTPAAELEADAKFLEDIALLTEMNPDDRKRIHDIAARHRAIPMPAARPEQLSESEIAALKNIDDVYQTPEFLDAVSSAKRCARCNGNGFEPPAARPAADEDAESPDLKAFLDDLIGMFPKDACWNETPLELVTALIDERDELAARLTAAARPTSVGGMCCLDCGCGDEAMPLDCVVTGYQWKQICPEESGVLCANCMVKRASKLPNVINLTARITSASDFIGEAPGGVFFQFLKRYESESAARPDVREGEDRESLIAEIIEALETMYPKVGIYSFEVQKLLSLRDSLRSTALATATVREAADMTRWEAFEAGWYLRFAIGECWDSRDVSRVMTADALPEAIKALATKLNGFRDKDHGIVEMKQLIRAALTPPAAVAEPTREDGV